MKQKNNSLQGWLFLTVILIELALTIYDIAAHRIPGGHDGFLYFILQYYFLNDTVFSGEIPQWMPFITHGTVATYWYAMQAGFLQNVLLLTAKIWQPFNFISLFHVGIFVDKLVLLTGVWLLARRYFKSPYTIFFVTVSVMASNIWMLQIWFNFHFYYAVPLILYLCHEFFDRGQWRYAFLAGNLLALQTLGNAPYFIPLTALVVFLYFFSHFIFHREDFKASLKKTKLGLAALAALSGIGLSLYAVFKITQIGVEQLVNYAGGRNRDLSLSLREFLNYAENMDFNKWPEMIYGISPALDYTLYIGLLPLIFLAAGCVFAFRKMLPLVLLVVTLLLLSMGTFVSSFFYHVWPLLKYFRHLGLVAPMIKMFLCFLAGFGMEAVFVKKISLSHPRPARSVFLALAVVFGGVTCWLFYLSGRLELAGQVMDRMMLGKGLPKLWFPEDTLRLRLFVSATFAGLTAAVCGILVSFNRQDRHRLLMGAVLLVQALNVYGYGWLESRRRMTVIGDPQLYAMTNFQPLPFAKRRKIDFDTNNPRGKYIKSLRVGYILYCATHAFLFKDQAINPYRTKDWLKPFDDFERAYWKRYAVDRFGSDESIKPETQLTFPLHHPAILKVAGIAVDKLQFFSHAYVAEETEISQQIVDAQYKGDILFLTSPNGTPVERTTIPWTSRQPLTAFARLNVPYQVKGFSSNRLEVEADVPQGGWMLYSDVWHPLWQAVVNGEEVGVYKANLIYKAVPLTQGKNHVQLIFKSRLMSLLQILFGLNSLFWVVILGGMILRGPLNLSRDQEDASALGGV